ncbi:uncharacterized protein LOC118590258 isoform X2 [Onychomys torridus]|uniref:uncharacterized protein LOC118590258 isoform X2 n=1 Tax=Onychomys torridus TaxID=38674 RepID=UPI00167F8AF9|nr:uncharacterized protein LOC118590258 isoform X2 [Onychomys torridus]
MRLRPGWSPCAWLPAAGRACVVHGGARASSRRSGVSGARCAAAPLRARAETRSEEVLLAWPPSLGSNPFRRPSLGPFCRRTRPPTRFWVPWQRAAGRGLTETGLHQWLGSTFAPVPGGLEPSNLMSADDAEFLNLLPPPAPPPVLDLKAWTITGRSPSPAAMCSLIHSANICTVVLLYSKSCFRH